MESKGQIEIENLKLVIDHFGYWPSFHDSEIISITLVRSIDNQCTSALMRVYAFEMTNKVVDGYYQLTKHCFIDFEVLELTKILVDGFNHQNVVLGLEFGERNGNMFCNILSSFGVNGYIEGTKIKIKRLELISGEHGQV